VLRCRQNLQLPSVLDPEIVFDPHLIGIG
jgi:hypothetical protein